MRTARLVIVSLVLWITVLALAPAPDSRVMAQGATPTPSPSPCHYGILAEFDTPSPDDLPLELQEVGVAHWGEVSVHDITFATTDERRITAYLVVPAGEGPFAGVLFVHRAAANGADRSQFLDEAVELARRGAVSLLVDTLWADTSWFANRYQSEDYAATVQQVIDLRRAVDVLLAQPGIDPARIGYVGHDFGATFGGVLAGVDRRFATVVLMAGIEQFDLWYSLGGRTDEDTTDDTRRASTAPLDPVCWIGLATPASVFFQFARWDGYIQPEDAQAYFDAASDPKEMKEYRTMHDLDFDEANQDRLAWLVRELGLAE